MKNLILILLLAAFAADARDVISHGRGGTPAAALLNAKMSAVEQIAGAFVVSQTNVDGNYVSQHIVNYSGAMIRSYVVIAEGVDNGVYSITIKADVDDSKDNNRIVSSESYIPIELKDKVRVLISDFKNTRQALDGLTDPSKAMIAFPTKMNFTVVNDNVIIDLSYAVKWQPKWYDDMLTLAKAIGKPEKATETKATYLMCFNDSKYVSMSVTNCYDMRSSFAAYKMRPTIGIVLKGLKMTHLPLVQSKQTLFNEFGPPHWTWMNCGIWHGNCQPQVPGVVLQTHGSIEGQYQIIVSAREFEEIETIDVVIQ